MSGPRVVSFGCRLNMAEGEAIRLAAGDADDLIVFNTCAVTAEAERQARQAIRKAARDNPGKRIMVTGCGAEVSRAAYEAMPEVARVVSQAETGRALEKPAVSGLDHARAFIEVQNGCDHDCTFCVTTLARGASRSLPAGAVIDAVKSVVARGQQEVVLTAVDLTSYGADLPGRPTLGMLVERILKAAPDLPRLRLSSLDCIEIDERLFDLIVHEPRLMPHLHLSLQSGDDMILKRMKRRHLRGDVIALVHRIKAVRNVSIGADLIAGFPTETEAMFANTLALIDEADVVLGHVFPFSPRPGTAAARMPQLPRELARARAARLRQRVAERQAAWLEAMVGTVQPIVVEQGSTGHAPNFARVSFLPSATARAVGSILPLRITGSDGQTLLGAAA